ncbi:MAG: YqiA/YcfP family alpha/beta fold hydrolase [Betaproteobacteria bacterium]|jgi:predicted esterase YcpF (UPF0227 family)
MSLIVYIHGFNSSASSYKAGVIQSAIQDHDKELQFWCPDLPHWPNEAVACLEREISQHDEVTLIGSSLGGYYATYLTERLGHRCVLINPAITPHEGLSAYVGKQTNLYTKEEYEFTVDHLSQLKALYVDGLSRLDRIFLIHTTGDELLDWKVAVKRYDGARQLIIQGSDHGFGDFGKYVDLVMAYVVDPSL